MERSLQRLLAIIFLSSTMILLYCYKVGIDPFTPIYVSLIESDDSTISHALFSYTFLGKTITTVLDVDLYALLIFPATLIPQCILVATLVKKLTNISFSSDLKKSYNYLIYLVSFMFVSLYTEGVYFFHHEVGALLFYTLLLVLMLLMSGDLPANRISLLTILILFTSINYTSYKLTFVAYAVMLCLYLLSLFEKRDRGNTDIAKRTMLYALLSSSILVLGFNLYLYNHALLVLSRYLGPNFIFHGFERFFALLYNKSMSLCSDDINLCVEIYKRKVAVPFGATTSYLAFILSTIFYVKNASRGLDRYFLLLLSVLVSSTFLAIFYNFLGLLLMTYLFLSLAFISTRYITLRHARGIQRGFQLVVLILMMTSIITNLLNVAMTLNERIIPVMHHEITLTSVNFIFDHPYGTVKQVYGDVYTIGYFATLCGERTSLESCNARYASVEELLKILAGKGDDIIFILNENLPWIELDNWNKIILPYESFRALAINNEVIYNAGKLLIVISRFPIGDV